MISAIQKIKYCNCPICDKSIIRELDNPNWHKTIIDQYDFIHKCSSSADFYHFSKHYRGCLAYFKISSYKYNLLIFDDNLEIWDPNFNCHIKYLNSSSDSIEYLNESLKRYRNSKVVFEELVESFLLI